MLLLLSTSSVLAQKVNTDSLWGIWNDMTQHDTLRLDALHKMAWNGFMYTRPDSAQKLAELEAKYAIETDNKKFEGKAYEIYGFSNLLFGQFDSSVYYYEKCQNLKQLIGDQHGYGLTINNLGLVYYSQGKFDLASDYYSKAIAHFKKLNSQMDVARSEINLALVQVQQGSFERAEETFKRNIAVTKEVGYIQGTSACLTNLGIIFQKRGDFAKALTCFSEALEIDRAINNLHGISTAIDNIGNIYIQQGNTGKAIEFFEQSVDLNSSIGRKKQALMSKSNVGLAYSKAKMYDKAKAVFISLLPQFEEINDQDGIASTRSNLGGVSFETGDMDKALEHYRMALSTYQKIGKKDGEALIHGNLGSVHRRMGNLEQALSHSKEAFDIAKEANLSLELLNASRAMTEIYLGMDSSYAALNYLDQLLELRNFDMRVNFPVLPESEKSLYLEKLILDYNLFFQITDELKDSSPELITTSYEYTLLLKGLLLRGTSTLRNLMLSSDNNESIQMYQDWIMLKRQISQAYSIGDTPADLEESANELEKKMIALFPDLQLGSTNVSIDEIRKELEAGEVAVDFVKYDVVSETHSDSIARTEYCALILKGDSKDVEMISLFNEVELGKILGSFPGNNLNYIEQVYGTGENTKTQLYDLIWNPMEKSLEGVEKVYVSPVGLLHKISFAALAKEQDVYLCDKYDIETMSSTGKIALNTFAPESFEGSDYTYTVFGGVDYNSDSTQKELWSYLEGSLTEAQKIKGTLKKNEVNYFAAKEASEENFKNMAPQSKILHIATHGFFYADPDEIKEDIVDEEESSEDLAFRGGKSGFGVESFVKNKNPLMRSGLAFAGANDVWNRTNIDGEDGVLTAAEVATIDMRNTELVVLSACETGLGDIKGSEGVYGLQRSFKMAGVKYLIMSLWQVPDKETAEFMTTFYQHLTKTNDIKQSFNQTQAEMRKKYDPYYWAAFVLVE